MIEVHQDVLGRSVLLDLAMEVKANHIASRHGRGQLELLVESFSLGSSHLRLGHVHLEMDRGIGVVLFVVLASVNG